MDKIEITRDDFKRAIEEVSCDMLRDDKLRGELKLLIPLIGMTFATKIEGKLFDEKPITQEVEK